jgi:hypothetical protein
MSDGVQIERQWHVDEANNSKQQHFLCAHLTRSRHRPRGRKHPKAQFQKRQRLDDLYSQPADKQCVGMSMLFIPGGRQKPKADSKFSIMFQSSDCSCALSQKTCFQNLI